jgi:8-oxo-dGTP diphosphatase
MFVIIPQEPRSYSFSFPSGGERQRLLAPIDRGLVAALYTGVDARRGFGRESWQEEIMRHSSDGIGIDHLALGFLRHEDSIVLVQQQGNPGLPPYWVVPGGLVEAGELIVDALIREVKEEAGVEATTIGRLTCLSQIDRPEHGLQTIAYYFEVEAWHGSFESNDPDDEILAVELVPLAEAISRLESNGGWPGIQEPMLAYLRGESLAGAMYFYREGPAGQQLIAALPA